MGEYLSFQDRVVAVTGGSRGIGASVVRELASLGAQVVFSWSSSKEKADALAAELTAQGYRVRAMQCDVTKNDSVKEFFASIAKTEGKLDGLVTAAGTIVRVPLALTKPEQFSEQFNVHVLGTTHCISAAVRLMTPHRYGRIVAISSVASLRGYGNRAAYAAAKAGVNAVVKSSARELAGLGITVNAVLPGFTDTDMTSDIVGEKRDKASAQVPVGRFARPEEIAYAVVALLHERASYLNGALVQVDGGLAM